MLQMDQSLSENSRELEVVERELQELEVCTAKLARHAETRCELHYVEDQYLCTNLLCSCVHRCCQIGVVVPDVQIVVCLDFAMQPHVDTKTTLYVVTLHGVLHCLDPLSPSPPFLQPRLDNVQSSLQRRSSSVAKVQAKINKLEDEVCKSL